MNNAKAAKIDHGETVQLKAPALPLKQVGALEPLFGKGSKRARDATPLPFSNGSPAWIAKPTHRYRAQIRKDQP